MISKDKKYKNKSGYEFKIYEIYEDKIHGATKGLNSWIIDSVQPEDLIEISPYEDFKIDDKVLVWDVTKKYKRHFAGLSDNGKPLTWSDGSTSFTSSLTKEWNNCIKYEENNEE